MGRIVVEQHVSADGFVSAADGSLAWVDAAGSPEAMTEIALNELEQTDAIVLGASTYRMFIGFWPGADPAREPLAEPINRLPKHIISRSLEEAPWGDHAPATVESGNLLATADRLVEMYERDIIVWGSLSVAGALLEGGRVDQIRLRVSPIVLGSGVPLWSAMIPPTRLSLADIAPLPTSQVQLTYDVR